MGARYDDVVTRKFKLVQGGVSRAREKKLDSCATVRTVQLL